MEIQINKPVIREGVIRSLTPENITNREAEFVISDETPDTYGTVFKINGWDLTRYERNPVVFYAHRVHSDNPDLLIGVSTVRIENNQLIGVVRFESAEINPLAEKVWQKIQAGTLRMASVGGCPKSGHWGDEKIGENRDFVYFDETELLEWSIVPIGSNPEAQLRQSELIDEIKKEIKIDVSIPDTSNIRNRTVREAQIIINNNL